jgi:hypothetical protein
MTLTYKQNQQLKQKLKELAVEGKFSPNCTSCGGTSLKFGEFLGGNLGPYMSGIGNMLVQRTCQDCGHVTLFDRKILGV